uniref:Uncharacterized protein n=1 Tax=Marmota marmota marmota TaxID=9994 RepID=A0A8C5ZKR1_MARMA
MLPPPGGSGERTVSVEAQLRSSSGFLALSLKSVHPEAPKPWPGPAMRRRPAGPQGEAGTHPLRLLVWEDARRPSSCEVAVDFEGVPGAPLVGIYPVFTWIRDREVALSLVNTPPSSPNHFRHVTGYSRAGRGVLGGLPHPSGQWDPGEKTENHPGSQECDKS